MRRLYVHAGLRTIVLTLLTVVTVAMMAPPGAAAETTPNASGRYDTLVLRDLGGKQAALVQLLADGTSFTQRELWRSKKGAFDVRKATFVAADVNGDGIADGVVLYDLGRSRSRLLIYENNGYTAKQRTGWTSRAGAFARTNAKLAVSDLDRDGRDDLLALYKTGTGVALYRFISKGTKFTQSLGYSTRSGLTWTKAQLAAGDVTGDGRGDGVVLYAKSSSRAQLFVFSGTGTKLTKKTYWSGTYVASRARLAVGDADSDGRADVVCLYRPGGSSRLDVFRSTGKSFAAPRTWYQNGSTPVPVTSRFCIGDVTGDGRADVVTAAATGSRTRFITWSSTGTAFKPQSWLTAAWPYAKVSLGVAPAAGLVVADGTEPLSNTTMRSLRAVEADGTLEFASKTGQLARLETGNVLLSGATPQFPDGLCRKVTSVSEQGGRVVVETTPAALSDVIDQGEIAFQMNLTAADLPDDGIAAPGVKLIRDRAAPKFPSTPLGSATDGFGFSLTTTILGFAEAEGEIWLDPDAYCDWEIGWGGLESAYYRQVLNTTTDLTVSMKKDYTGTKEITLYKRTLTAITIMAGPVPVVITPELEVKVGVEGEIVAGVTAGMTLGTSTWAEVSYDDGWGLDYGSTYDCTPQPPQLFGGLEVTGFTSGGLAFELYGVAGPEAALKPYVKLEAATNADPWWQLKAGLDGEIGMKAELLDHEIASKEYTFNFFEYVLDQAGSDSSGGGSSGYEMPSVRGKILDASSGQVVRSASVEISQGDTTLRQTSSAADGTYVFSGLAPGTYTVTAGKNGYADNTRSVTVVSGQTTLNQDVQLTRLQFQGVKGYVLTDAGHSPIFQAQVELYEPDDRSYSGWWHLGTVSTLSDGSYEFTGLSPGTYRLVAKHPYYYSESLEVTISGGQLAENKNLYLVHYSNQGVHGRVIDSLNGLPVSGARVVVFEGGGEGGYFESETTTSGDGSFFVDALDNEGLAVGTHGLIISKQGYVEYRRDFQISRGAITQLGDIRLQQVGGHSMRSERGSSIIWTDGAPTATGRGTYEFWYRPLALFGTEWGNQIAQVAWSYPDWQGTGAAQYAAMVISAQEVPVGGSYAPVIFFHVVENKQGADPSEPGTYHTLQGTTPLTLGTWYHIAAQYGPNGMKLFVNGHLEASNSYAGAPEPFAGASGSAWFSLGEHYLDGSGRPHTAGGDYRGLRVSEWDEYDGNFTPYDLPSANSDTLVYDELDGSTNGVNEGFVPTP